MSNTNFKLVILDYAFKQINKPLATQVLNDLIVMKQSNFLRTDPSYVVMDKHDMIGTHFLVYDTSALYTPKLVFALRTTYEERCVQHKVKTPFQDLVPRLDQNCQVAYESFHKKYPKLVDCNSWCVDPDYSMKKSGLNLSDIGYVMVYLQLSKMGHSHFIGCTNEKYRASRWLENVGSFPKGYEFIHPAVPDKHMITMVDNFNHQHMSKIYQSYSLLFEQLIEICPDNLGHKSIKETILELFTPESHSYIRKVA